MKERQLPYRRPDLSHCPAVIRPSRAPIGRRAAIIFALCAAICAVLAQDAAAAKLNKIGSFYHPVYVTSPPGDAKKLFVVTRSGRIWIVQNGKRLKKPFLDIRYTVRSGDGERGLMSMAFPPDYKTSRRFYVYYSNKGGDARLREFKRSRTNPNRANRTESRFLLKIEHTRKYNHYSGMLQFRGPLLFVGTGDGGCCKNFQRFAQNLHSLQGKILRIDPRPGHSRIPRGNPYRAPGGARGEIFAFGLRNPWRFSFDRANGDFIMGDVGEDLWEEIDFRRAGTLAGTNFGWSAFEGFSTSPAGGVRRGAVKPSFVKSHRAGWCAIAGGYVVRDRSVPSLYGRYVYGDFCRDEIRSVRLSRSGKPSGDRKTALAANHTVSFGQDSAGHVYVVSYAGRVSRIVR